MFWAFLSGVMLMMTITNISTGDPAWVVMLSFVAFALSLIVSLMGSSDG